jgi:hydroxyacylglutathione hydrolase
MKLSEHVHEIRKEFQSVVGNGGTVTRAVNLWLIGSEKIYMIDSGVASSDRVVFDYIRSIGRQPQEVALLVLTHAHPDHIGSGPSIVRQTGCKTAAHIKAVPWIENVDLQFNERPLDNFFDLVEGSFKIDRIIADGDTLQLGDDLHLNVIHTPGHSADSASLFLKADGVLFSGDAIPVAGDLPIYEDVPDLIASIRKLKNLKDVKILCSSWNKPQYGDSIDDYIEASLAYLQHIHDKVCQVVKSSPLVSPKDLCAGVLKKLGLPDASNKKNVVTSIEAHRRCCQRENLLV